MKRDTTFTWCPGDGSAFKGRNVIVVGGTGGIGRALSGVMAAGGAHVLVVGQTFRDAGTAGIEFIAADLSLLHQAQAVAARLPAETADLVVFTTGIFAAPERQQTAEGLERDLAVSYLNRLVMLRELAPRLGRQPKGTRPRVFVWGFPGTGQAGTVDDLNAERSYKAMAAHMNTVAGNEALVLDAAKRYPHLDVFGMNPGLIKTNIRSNFLGAGTMRFRMTEALIGLLTPSADAYAARIAPLLASPDLEGRSGTMFDRKGRAILPSAAMTDAHVGKLMAASQDVAARAGVRVV